MQIEKQLASLEQSKLLVEAAERMGVELLESYFWWNAEEKDIDYWIDGKPTFNTFSLEQRAIKHGMSYPAYSVAELGMMLRMGMHRSSMNANEEWVVTFMPLNSTRTDGKKDEYMEMKAPTEADARCKMLTHLINQGLITKV